MAGTYRYKAFISYSHSDRRFANWLLTSLEGYRLPKRLSPADSAGSALRVGRIFRDRDELPAAEDLTAEVKMALASSEFMIVICSPAAAASRWVNREIIEFKKLNGEGKILSVILSGEPFASKKQQPEQECFPPALRFRLGRGGQITRVDAEPLAADFRAAGDGRKRGLLKLVAGLMGLSLDTLVARDLQRKMRHVTMVTAASVVAMVGMGLLTYEAVTARQEAEHQRSEAEGLIEFMLTDLRMKLIGVAGSVVRTEVIERAMQYYNEQENLEKLPTESLDRRARVLFAWGYEDEMRRNWSAAREKYEEFHRTAQVLWQRDPGNTDRILAYATGKNRLALTDHSTKGRAMGFDRFVMTRDILDTVSEADKGSARYLRLPALVDGNLCAIHWERGSEPSIALPYCDRAITQSERAIALEPDDRQLRYDYHFHLLWRAENMARAGDLEGAEGLLARAMELCEALVAEEPENARWQEQKAELYKRFASFIRSPERRVETLDYLKKAKRVSSHLVSLDADNIYWAQLDDDLTTLLEKESSNVGY
jgi:tetratricopeptide (TPR) repeat protein